MRTKAVEADRAIALGAEMRQALSILSGTSRLGKRDPQRLILHTVAEIDSVLPRLAAIANELVGDTETAQGAELQRRGEQS